MAADASGLRRKVAAFADLTSFAAAKATLEDAVGRAPEDTGTLKLSRFGPRRAGPASWTIGFGADWASHTDKGTRPHVIRPRRAKALRFVVGGQVVFARRVQHPGTRGTQWFTRATSERAWAGQVRSAARRTRV